MKIFRQPVNTAGQPTGDTESNHAPMLIEVLEAFRGRHGLLLSLIAIGNSMLAAATMAVVCVIQSDDVRTELRWACLAGVLILADASLMLWLSSELRTYRLRKEVNRIGLLILNRRIDGSPSA
jgi:hypothetical protein